MGRSAWVTAHPLVVAVTLIVVAGSVPAGAAWGGASSTPPGEYGAATAAPDVATGSGDGQPVGRLASPSDSSLPDHSAPDGDLRVTTLQSGLDQPTEVTFLPDGRMLVLEKAGDVVIVDDSGSSVETGTYLDLPSVNSTGERGLVGITLDPDFETNGYLYLYYTNETSTDPYARIARFTHLEGSGGADSTAGLSSEVVVWENPNPASHPSHVGGGLDVGPDGKLYLTTGDGHNASLAQDLSRAEGKVIRVDRDGTIPSDNPYVGDPDAMDAIWASGLRNPFRASWDDGADRFLIGEVGEDTFEDVHVTNSTAPGLNFGWPDCEGPCDDSNYSDPIYSYEQAPGYGASITGGEVYREIQFPAEYRGAYFYGDYVRGWIKYLTFDDHGDVAGSHTFLSMEEDDPISSGVVDVSFGPNGSLYWLDITGGTLNKVEYQGGNRAPVIDEASANVTSGLKPLPVAFTGAARDPDGDELNYQWVFGDGSDSSGKNATHTYTVNGKYTAYLEVSDGDVTTTSDPIEISVGPPPSVTIETPANGSTFRAGDTIAYEGTASDPVDGTIPPENLSWTVEFVHGEHTHPWIPEHSGTNGTFPVPGSPEEGHTFTGDTGFRVTLTATDSDGLTNSTSVVVYPEKVNLTVRTQPSGLEFLLDGKPRTAPYVVDTAVEYEHTLEAPTPQTQRGAEYHFQGWSDGGDRKHNVTAPADDTTYIATYTAPDERFVVPPEFEISIYSNATELGGRGFYRPGPGNGTRILRFYNGTLYTTVSDREGTDNDHLYAVIDDDEDGVADRVELILSNPEIMDTHGFDFHDGHLYLVNHDRYGDQNEIVRYEMDGIHADTSTETVLNDTLPHRGEYYHWTRTLAVEDGHIWVTAGSQSNNSVPTEPWIAEMTRCDLDGTDCHTYAEGLRNAVGFTFHDGKLFATDNGRDGIGDYEPPDEINVVRQGEHYGWPHCYGQNVPDPEYDDPAICADRTPAAVNLPAHTVPLGLDFWTDPSVPAAYRGDMYVAMHGSHSDYDPPKGYKVVRVPYEDGQLGQPADFATGWYESDGDSDPYEHGDDILGRPVDVTIGPDGAMYVSDDSSGTIFRIAPRNEPPNASFSYSPDEPVVDETVTFDASNSTDPDGTIESYAWDFDGDGETDATGETVLHTFGNVSEHAVTLTVTDDSGVNDTVSTNVTVQPAPICTGCEPPNDPDGDGLYEDVNGDGTVTFSDVVTLYHYWDGAFGPVEVEDPFDFNGDGSLTFSDVVALYHTS